LTNNKQRNIKKTVKVKKTERYDIDKIKKGFRFLIELCKFIGNLYCLFSSSLRKKGEGNPTLISVHLHAPHAKDQAKLTKELSPIQH